jgi:hypothetical protein
MTDRTQTTLTRLAFVAVPALVSFAGSYAAVRAALDNKVDRVEFVREVGRIDLELARRGADTDEVRRRLDAIQQDIRALVCAQRPRPATCP